MGACSSTSSPVDSSSEWPATANETPAQRLSKLGALAQALGVPFDETAVPLSLLQLRWAGPALQSTVRSMFSSRVDLRDLLAKDGLLNGEGINDYRVVGVQANTVRVLSRNSFSRSSYQDWHRLQVCLKLPRGVGSGASMTRGEFALHHIHPEGSLTPVVVMGVALWPLRLAAKPFDDGRIGVVLESAGLRVRAVDRARLAQLTEALRRNQEESDKVYASEEADLAAGGALYHEHRRLTAEIAKTHAEAVEIETRLEVVVPLGASRLVDTWVVLSA